MANALDPAVHFTLKDGRQYHNEAEVAYVLPNDYDGTAEIDKKSNVNIVIYFCWIRA